jgi:hypothetical protein
MGFSMRGAQVSNEYFKPPEPTQEQRKLANMQYEMRRAEQETRQQIQRQMEDAAREQRRQLEQAQRESARQVEEQRRQVESQAREQARLAETFRRQAEDAQRQTERQANELRRQAEEATRRAEQVRQDAERRNAEDGRRQIEEAERRAAESRRQAEESARRAHEARERANQAAEVERQRKEYADQQKRQSAGAPSSDGGIRAAVEEIRRKAEEGAKSFWKTGKTGDDSTDDKKYGFALPRFSTVDKAEGHYTSAEIFDPKQTLFRYDPQTLNNIARQEFYKDSNHAEKKFVPPHDTSKPVYQGVTKREGIVDKLARAWNFQESSRNPAEREQGAYLFDIRNYKNKFGKDIQQKLDAGQGVAVRAWVAMPGQAPNRISAVETAPWKLGDNFFEERINPDTGKLETHFVRAVMVSNTIGEGEQVILHEKSRDKKNGLFRFVNFVRNFRR